MATIEVDGPRVISISWRRRQTDPPWLLVIGENHEYWSSIPEEYEYAEDLEQTAKWFPPRHDNGRLTPEGYRYEMIKYIIKVRRFYTAGQQRPRAMTTTNLLLMLVSNINHCVNVLIEYPETSFYNDGIESNYSRMRYLFQSVYRQPREFSDAIFPGLYYRKYKRSFRVLDKFPVQFSLHDEHREQIYNEFLDSQVTTPEIREIFKAFALDIIRDHKLFRYYWKIGTDIGEFEEVVFDGLDAIAGSLLNVGCQKAISTYFGTYENLCKRALESFTPPIFYMHASENPPRKQLQHVSAAKYLVDRINDLRVVLFLLEEPFGAQGLPGKCPDNDRMSVFIGNVDRANEVTKFLDLEILSKAGRESDLREPFVTTKKSRVERVLPNGPRPYASIRQGPFEGSFFDSDGVVAYWNDLARKYYVKEPRTLYQVRLDREEQARKMRAEAARRAQPAAGLAFSLCSMKSFHIRVPKRRRTRRSKRRTRRRRATRNRRRV